MNRYEYTPLRKSNSLRLLQMLPEDENGMVQVSLDEYDLDEHIPTYGDHFKLHAPQLIDV